jgi:hypothetical protein
MARTLHKARITGPVTYVAASGRHLKIPLGPCLVEQLDDHRVDIVWGVEGQRSTTLPVSEVANAEESGRLVLLD